MGDKNYNSMSVTELKKEQQRLWEIAVQAQRNANKSGNGEEIHRQRASYAMNEVRKIGEELLNRDRKY